MFGVTPGCAFATRHGRVRFACVVVSLLAFFGLWPDHAHAATVDVTTYGAKGDGVTDDTTAINNAVAALQPGDTLYFPCTSGGSTYVITAQLAIIRNGNQVLLSNITVEGDPSGCVTIKDECTGPYQGAIMLIGGDSNGNPNPSLGTAVSLGAVANELSTSFTTVSSLGVAAGDYIYLCEGGPGGNNGGTNIVCGTTNQSVTCDPAGCRGEIVKVAVPNGRAERDDNFDVRIRRFAGLRRT